MDHTDEEVTAVVHAMWQSDADRAEALATLSRYGAAPHHREVPRVRLAALKLSQGRLDRLTDLVAKAKRDYRNILMWAEYPEESRMEWRRGAQASPGENERVAGIRRRDRTQYAAWLSGKLRRPSGE